MRHVIWEASNTYVLEATAICCETFVEGDSVTLVVLPVRDTRGYHPLFLLLSGCLARWTSKNGWGWAWGATRYLLVLETRRFKWILHNFIHLDDTLLQPIRTTLLPRRIPYERRLSLAVRNVFGLGRFDLPIHQLLQSCSRLLRCCLDLLFGWAVHGTLFFI